MRNQKRRPRKTDLLANPASVRKVCAALRDRCPAFIPKTNKELISLLNAVRHAESHASTASKRGRPSLWLRADLLTIASELKAILARETQRRISLSSFVGVYLRILQFPADVITALESGQLNLQEATLLARLTAERLATMPRQAKALRQEVIAAHLQAHGSQNSLRARVQSLLGETAAIVSSETMTEAVQKVDKLLEIDPKDVHHLFFEEIRNLFYALKEIEPEEVMEDDIARFSQATDQIFNVIQGIRQRRKRQLLPRPFQL